MGECTECEILNGWILKMICLTPCHEVYGCAWMSTHITWVANWHCMQQGNPETRSKTVSRLCCQCIEDWTQKTNWFIIYSLAKYHAFCLLIGRAGYNSEFWFLVEMQACPCLSMWATLNANIALEINKIYFPIFTNI